MKKFIFFIFFIYCSMLNAIEVNFKICDELGDYFLTIYWLKDNGDKKIVDKRTINLSYQLRWEATDFQATYLREVSDELWELYISFKRGNKEFFWSHFKICKDHVTFEESDF